MIWIKIKNYSKCGCYDYYICYGRRQREAVKDGFMASN